MESFTGIVLAGGKSRRFGSPKSFAERNGKQFFQHSIDAIDPFVKQLFIVTNTSLKVKFPKSSTYEVITDTESYEGFGPLAGIYTVMERQPSDWFIVMPTDVPFMNRGIVEKLMNYTNLNVDVIVPFIAEKRQPLISIYHYSTKNIIKQHLEEGKLSVHQLLACLRVKEVPFDDHRAFLNINSQVEYKKYVNRSDGDVPSSS